MKKKITPLNDGTDAGETANVLTDKPATEYKSGKKGRAPRRGKKQIILEKLAKMYHVEEMEAANKDKASKLFEKIEACMDELDGLKAKKAANKRIVQRISLMLRNASAEEREKIKMLLMDDPK